LGKRSVALDLERAEDRERLVGLVGTADVLRESMARGYLDGLGVGQAALRARYPGLLFARMSPFGDEGPWVDYKASDLVHLALGGPMVDRGYDLEPGGVYDLPPIAPAMWHSYHVAGELLAMNIM